MTDDDRYDAFREHDVLATPRHIADALWSALMTPSLPRTWLCDGCALPSDGATGWESCGEACNFCGRRCNTYTTGTVRNLRSVR